MGEIKITKIKDLFYWIASKLAFLSISMPIISLPLVLMANFLDNANIQGESSNVASEIFLGFLQLGAMLLPLIYLFSIFSYLKIKKKFSETYYNIEKKEKYRKLLTFSLLPTAIYIILFIFLAII